MTSTKFSDFLTPSPLSAFGTYLYCKIHTTTLTTSTFPWTPSPLRCGHHIWRLPYPSTALQSAPINHNRSSTRTCVNNNLCAPVPNGAWRIQAASCVIQRPQNSENMQPPSKRPILYFFSSSSPCAAQHSSPDEYSIMATLKPLKNSRL